VAGKGVGGLEAVAGDAGDGDVVGRDAAVGVEACGDGGGDAAGGLCEDAFGFGEFLDAGDDLDVRDVFGPASLSRIMREAAGPSLGLPMASERAMVLGRWGTTSSVPCFTATEMGEQPVAWAPKKRTGLSSTRPR
jgi:hypothetical protein